MKQLAARGPAFLLLVVLLGAAVLLAYRLGRSTAGAPGRSLDPPAASGQPISESRVAGAGESDLVSPGDAADPRQPLAAPPRDPAEEGSVAGLQGFEDRAWEGATRTFEDRVVEDLDLVLQERVVPSVTLRSDAWPAYDADLLFPSRIYR